jgi:hypothetical protein
MELSRIEGGWVATLHTSRNHIVQLIPLKHPDRAVLLAEDTSDKRFVSTLLNREQAAELREVLTNFIEGTEPDKR